MPDWFTTLSLTFSISTIIPLIAEILKTKTSKKALNNKGELMIRVHGSDGTPKIMNINSCNNEDIIKLLNELQSPKEQVNNQINDGGAIYE